MPLRQIVLDTETTGLRVEEGHRIIEMGCVELIDRKFTNSRFHHYVNPEREVESAALNIHGISNEFLKDKPVFKIIAEDFLNFIRDAEVIIHNAPFDLSFINNEMLLIQQDWTALTDYCRVTDTLQMARKLHVGQRNSLDALCKRYGIDLSKRDLHGALLDAHLLAQVYLAMTGGQGSFFDSPQNNLSTECGNTHVSTNISIQEQKLVLLKTSEEELESHEKYLQQMKEHGKCLWLKE